MTEQEKKAHDILRVVEFKYSGYAKEYKKKDIYNSIWRWLRETALGAFIEARIKN